MSPTLLRLFRRTHVDDPHRIAQLLAANDWDALSHLAHALRGSSGSIGATGTERASAALERELRSASPNGDTRRALGSALQAELRGLLAGLPRDSDPVGAGPPTEPALVTRPDCESILERLENLLIAGDIACESCIAENLVTLRALLGERSTILVEHVSNFRFDEALALLGRRVAE